MSSNRKVSLQINLAPGDYLHVRHILPHQLKKLAGQVDEILLVVDSRPSKGRFAAGWHEYRETLNNFLTEEVQAVFDVKIIPVDYSDTTRQAVAQYFFGNLLIPEKDFRGGPFYAYFFGLYMAAHDLVFHLDSDILLGGGSSSWIGEAVSLFTSDPNCFIVSPLPGPPHTEEVLIDQQIIQKIGRHTWQLGGMSTRLFMMDRVKIHAHKLSLTKPGIRNQLKALAEGNPNADLPEHLLNTYLLKHRLKRIDFLGSGKGLWSLHPPYRSRQFYDELPELLIKIDTGDLPLKQYGYYDIIDELVDWTEAKQQLQQNRWWKRK
jgi:hypothetical protein